MRRKTVLTIILIITSCLSLIMVIAFALLSTNFTINFGNITKPSQTWNVFIQNATYTANTGNGDTSTAGRHCPGGSATANQISINSGISLSKPNDYCSWAFTVKNDGTIDAKLSSITATGVTDCTFSNSEVVCGPIKYYIATNSTGTSKLAVNAVVSKNNGTATYYMIAKFNQSSILTTGVTIYATPTIKLNFAQY